MHSELIELKGLNLDKKYHQIILILRGILFDDIIWDSDSLRLLSE